MSNGKGFSPFGKKSKARKFHAIVNELGQAIYLEQVGFVKVKERTPSLEVAEKERLFFQLEACNAIAESKGITITEAMKQLTGDILVGKNGDRTFVPPTENIFRWLDETNKRRYCDLSIDRKPKEEAVAAVISNRQAYAVVLAEDAPKNATTLKLKQELIFPLDAGDVIRFGHQKVEVTESYAPSDDEYEENLELKVEKLSTKIKADVVGFLLEGGTEKVGMEIEDKAMIGEMSPYQLDLIYEFYQSESTGTTSEEKDDEALDDIDIEERLGNSEMKSREEEQTGLESGQESSTPELLTPASV